jgi:hypothetical protein
MEGIYLFQVISTCLRGCQRKMEGSQHPVGLSRFNLMSKAKEIAAEFLYKREMNSSFQLFKKWIHYHISNTD